MPLHALVLCAVLAYIPIDVLITVSRIYNLGLPEIAAVLWFFLFIAIVATVGTLRYNWFGGVTD